MSKLSSSKGAGFELTICRDLTQWLVGVTKPELFWRTKGLGPKGTRGRWTGKTRHGDIKVMEDNSEVSWLTDHLFWECKFYRKKSWSFDDHMKGQGRIIQWWTKLLHQAQEAEKIPIMVVKRNYYPVCVLYDCRLNDHLLNCSYAPVPSMHLINQSLGTIYCDLWTDFLEHVNPWKLEESVKNAYTN